MSHPEKRYSVGESDKLLLVLEVMQRLKLISEETFQDTAQYFDDFSWEYHNISWEQPPDNYNG